MTTIREASIAATAPLASTPQSPPIPTYLYMHPKAPMSFNFIFVYTTIPIYNNMVLVGHRIQPCVVVVAAVGPQRGRLSSSDGQRRPPPPHVATCHHVGGKVSQQTACPGGICDRVGWYRRMYKNVVHVRSSQSIVEGCGRGTSGRRTSGLATGRGWRRCPGAAPAAQRARSSSSGSRWSGSGSSTSRSSTSTSTRSASNTSSNNTANTTANNNISQMGWEMLKPDVGLLWLTVVVMTAGVLVTLAFPLALGDLFDVVRQHLNERVGTLPPVKPLWETGLMGYLAYIWQAWASAPPTFYPVLARLCACLVLSAIGNAASSYLAPKLGERFGRRLRKLTMEVL